MTTRVALAVDAEIAISATMAATMAILETTAEVTRPRRPIAAQSRTAR
jgi:hypothetical protein